MIIQQGYQYVQLLIGGSLLINLIFPQDKIINLLVIYLYTLRLYGYVLSWREEESLHPLLLPQRCYLENSSSALFLLPG